MAANATRLPFISSWRVVHLYIYFTVYVRHGGSQPLPPRCAFWRQLVNMKAGKGLLDRLELRDSVIPAPRSKICKRLISKSTFSGELRFEPKLEMTVPRRPLADHLTHRERLGCSMLLLAYAVQLIDRPFTSILTRHTAATSGGQG